jgi:hypothetical protein
MIDELKGVGKDVVMCLTGAFLAFAFDALKKDTRDNRMSCYPRETALSLIWYQVDYFCWICFRSLFNDDVM